MQLYLLGGGQLFQERVINNGRELLSTQNGRELGNELL